jgi:replicative DNA helicase
MSAEQLASRILSEQTNISSSRMRKGELTNEEFERLSAGSSVLYEIPIFIDDTPALTVSALRTRARRLKRQHNLSMIVVDYLQLIASPPGSRNDGRVQEVSEITRGLKTLAKELEVPVLALSQLSRAVEQRDNKRPQLADLRESGSIEQDADVVMFIFREEYYLERDEPVERQDEKPDKFAERKQRHDERLEKVRNIAEVIIAKQRHGPIGTAYLQFHGAFTRFGNLDQGHGSEF